MKRDVWRICMLDWFPSFNLQLMLHNQNYWRILRAIAGIRWRWAITRSSTELIARKTIWLKGCFETTNSGKCAFVLDIDLVKNNDGSVTMCSRRYINDILKRFGMNDCTAVIISTDIGLRLLPSDTPNKVEAPFRKAAGALIHIMTATRPDIAFAAKFMWRFMKYPQIEHWAAVKRILRYLQETKAQGIRFWPGD